MLSLLTKLRQTPQLAPARFLMMHPGCWVQYYDDTPAKDPGKALSTNRFIVAEARGKQAERCAVCYSLQAFGDARTREGFLSFRNFGVDVDLVEGSQKGSVSPEEIDRRKEEYLSSRLQPFPLHPHWLVETRHGFHVVFRVKPFHKEGEVQEGLAVNRALVVALHGDDKAVLLTQVLRVPGTFQFKDPRAPFLCRLLLDTSGKIPPYPIADVRTVLDALGAFHTQTGSADRKASDAARAAGWREGRGGVPEGQRNATAASLAGGILRRLPENLWEIAGWGGLKEWNSHNSVPLPERELRAVFQSIAGRERARRGRAGHFPQKLP